MNEWGSNCSIGLFFIKNNRHFMLSLAISVLTTSCWGDHSLLSIWSGVCLFRLLSNSLRIFGLFSWAIRISQFKDRLQFAGQLDCNWLNSRPSSFYPCESLANSHAFGAWTECGAVLHLVFLLVDIFKKQVFAKSAGRFTKFFEFRLDLESLKLVFIFHFSQWVIFIGVSRRIRNRKDHVLS